MGKREDILMATLDLITEEGLQSITFAKIFKRANVASATFYYYFENKEELVNELYKQSRIDMGEVVMEKYDPTVSIYERFKYFLKNVMDYAIKYPKELWFMENYSHSPYISEELRNMNDKSMTEFFTILSEGQKQGFIKSMDINLCCQLVFGVILSVAKGLLLKKYKLNDLEIIQIIESCWKLIRI